MYRILIIIILLSVLMLPARGQELLLDDINETFLVASGKSDVHINQKIVWSDNVKDHFKIFISLPRNYDSMRIKKYPVVYFLDGGNPSFHHTNSDYMKKGLIPEVITIGIGYPDANNRNRDYSYGFNEFYKFMKHELIPQMDKSYNINPTNRTLYGHSYGGLCVLFTLFEYYDYNDILFHNLIAASPSLWYGDWQQANIRESLLFERNQILPVNLYMGVGSEEGFMVTDLQKMQKTLTDHNYKYLNMTSAIYEGKNHTTAKDKTYREGIQWIFDQDIKILTSINTDTFTQNTIATGLYPNPATHTINLIIPTSSTNQNINFKITNITGKELKTFNKQINGQTNLQISVAELPKGLYMIHLSKGLEKQTLKFIKQ